MIIFGQGAIRCHPYILKEMEAAQNKDLAQGAIDFDKALFGHIGFTISNGARAFWLGLTGGRLSPVPLSSQGPEAYYYRQATRMSAAFALVADVAMLTLGGSLKRKEKFSGRLADMLSQLYLISACLKRYHDDGCPEADLPLLQWACDDALYQMQESLRGLLRNFSFRPLAAVLRFIIMPWGKSYHLPVDKLGHKAAQLLLSPSEVRDRLTEGVYVPQGQHEALGRLEDALVKVIAAEPVERMLRAAVKSGKLRKAGEEELVQQGLAAGVIEAHEAEQIRAAIAARAEVIKVDDFPQDYWSKP